jgi:hypothetical protein
MTIYSEIMNVQRVIGMFFEEEHIQREIPVREHKFPFEFDGLDSANGCGGIHPPTTGSLRRLPRIIWFPYRLFESGDWHDGGIITTKSGDFV